MRKHFFTLLFLVFSIVTEAQKVEYLVKPTFDFSIAYPFLNGLSKVVTKDSYKGFVDRQGNIAIPLQYAEVSQYNGFVILEDINRKWIFTDNKGKKIDTLKVKVRRQTKNGLKWVDLNGKVNVTDTLDRPVKIWQWQPRNMDFLYLPDFDFTREPPQEGVIDENYKGGYASVSGNGKKKTIDLSEKKIKKFGGIWYGFFDGMASFTSLDFNNVDKYRNTGFINRKGDIIIPPEYAAPYPFSEGYVFVRKNRTLLMMDKLGKVMAQYDSTYYSGAIMTNGLAIIGFYNGFGFVDKSGKVVLKFPIDKFDEIMAFSEGLAWVSKGKKWGCINKKGEMVIPFEFDDTCKYFSEGLAWVKLNGKWGIIKNPLAKK
jgi:WG containing repeat